MFNRKEPENYYTVTVTHWKSDGSRVWGCLWEKSPIDHPLLTLAIAAENFNQKALLKSFWENMPDKKPEAEEKEPKKYPLFTIGKEK